MSKKLLVLSFFPILLFTIGAGCTSEEAVNSPQNNVTSTLTPTSMPTLTPTPVIKKSVLPTKEEVTQLDKIAETKSAVIETDKGTIKIKLYPKDAPLTVANFVKLINEKFYDGVIFHRVVSGFVIQGGDPTGTGRGGPGYQFADELNPNAASYKEGYVKGVVAMANAGPNTNGSQFFIMLKDTPLPHAYSIFGKVVSRQDAVDAIGVAPTNPSDDRPLTPVTIIKAYIEK